jgi:hypothetical protein
MKSHKKTGKNSKLVQEWKTCTGDSEILDIKRINYHSGALNYVLKYLTKGLQDLTNEEKGLFFKLTFKRRLIFTFGEFYKIKEEKRKATCKNCGCSYQYIKPGSEEYEFAEKWFEEKKPPPDLLYWII